MALPRTKRWIAKAVAGMRRRGTVGAYSARAKRLGHSVKEQTRLDLKKGSRTSTTIKRRALFARNVGRLRR